MRRWNYVIFTPFLIFILSNPACADFSTTRTDIDTAANTAYSAVCVDLDQDGDMDIVAAINADNDVVWYENAGSPSDAGNWTKRTIEGDFNGAISVFPIDLDKDGDIDIVAAANTEDDISWFENRGDPTEAATTTTDDDWREILVEGNFDGARSVHALDMDFDGDIDIVACADTEDDVAWFENRGDPTELVTPADATDDWREITVEGDFDGANSVYPIDLDRDGDIDIVGAANADNDIAWFENRGDPTELGTPADTSDDWREISIDITFNGANSVFPLDMDRDGDIDVLASANTDDDISWFENRGDPTGALTTTTDDDWIERSVDASHDAPNFVIASDVDGDGDFDIICAADSAGSEEISWWSSDGNPKTGTWTQTVLDSTVGNAMTVTPYDLDRDGDIDIIQSAANRVSWFPSDINRSASDIGFKNKAAVDSSVPNARAASAVDLDRDGEMDVVGVSPTEDKVSWWKNNGSESFTQYDIDTNLDDAWFAFAVDLDIDGNIDVVACSRRNDAIYWYDSDGNPTGSWTKRAVSTSINGPNDMISIDLDRDGDLDLVTVTYDSRRLIWYASRGSPTTSSNWNDSYIVYQSDNSLTSVKSADLDKDGDYDLVISSDTGGFIKWFANDGTPANGGWDDYDVDTAVGQVKSLRLADINKDGNLDIVGVINDGNDVDWWENDGTPAGGWVQNNIYDALIGAETAFVEDIDRDGDLDVFAMADELNDVYWFANSSSGSTWTSHILDYDFAGPNSTFAVDMDKDGDIDLLGAGSTSADISWWENVTSTDADTPEPNVMTGSGLPITVPDSVVVTPPGDVQTEEQGDLPVTKKKEVKKKAPTKKKEPKKPPFRERIPLPLERELTGDSPMRIMDYDNMLVLHYITGAKVIVIINPAKKKTMAFLFEKGVDTLGIGESLRVKEERGPYFVLKNQGFLEGGERLEFNIARLIGGMESGEHTYKCAVRLPEEDIARHLFSRAQKD